MSIPKVPIGHPRVYVRPEDLPAIRAKIDNPEFARAWQVVRKQADCDDAPMHGGPLCNAFLYLITGDKARGRTAIEQALPVLKASTDARVFHEPFHWAPCIYDWCYDLLTPDEKQAFIREFIRIANSHSPWYPARRDVQATVGHIAEGWLLTGQLPAGVAIHDESPEMYEAAARLFFDKFVPVRNYHYPSHAHHQGDHYTTRIIYDLGASWLFRRMGAGDVLSRDQQFVQYQFVYNLLPNRRQFMRGDGTGDIRSGRRRTIMMLAGTYYADPYLLGLADSDLFDNQLSPFHEVFDLLFRPANIQPRPIGELPLAKSFGPPLNDLVFRTGWTLGPESDDTVFLMRIGGTFFGNHQFRDMGTFQVYHRGLLALSTGVYNYYGNAHWKAYYHQTLAHNGLLIHDPDEPIDRVTMVNSGGQRIPNGLDHPPDLETLKTKGYELAHPTGCSFGPDPKHPEYAYLAGDITRAYTDKVRQVTRSMVALNLANQAHPAALVVFDRVISSNPAFKKTWLLHTIQEPVVDRNTITVLRDQPPYHGKMEVRTLLPVEADIRTIGGPDKDFWVNTVQQNFPAETEPEAEVGVAGWRVEISPAQPQESDLFLNVMTVMDAAQPAGPDVRQFGDESVIGIALLDRAILFHRTSEPWTDVSFALPASGPAAMKILACDLAPGYWRVTVDNQPLHDRLPVTRTAASLYFEGPPGRYTLKRVDTTAPPEQAPQFWQEMARRSLEATGNQ